MAEIRHAFPSVVTLPTSVTTEHHELRIALADPSPQLLHLWRRERGFPPSYRDGNATFCVTAEVERWLKNQDIEVRRA